MWVFFVHWMEFFYLTKISNWYLAFITTNCERHNQLNCENFDSKTIFSSYITNNFDHDAAVGQQFQQHLTTHTNVSFLIYLWMQQRIFDMLELNDFFFYCENTLKSEPTHVMCYMVYISIWYIWMVFFQYYKSKKGNDSAETKFSNSSRIT